MLLLLFCVLPQLLANEVSDPLLQIKQEKRDERIESILWNMIRVRLYGKALIKTGKIPIKLSQPHASLPGVDGLDRKARIFAVGIKQSFLRIEEEL